MKNIFKSLFLLTITAVVTTSCVKDDDFAIPSVRATLLYEDFETITPGSSSTEIPIALEGWINTNTSGSRLWIGKEFDDNKFAEFSSFYSASGSSDETWLITPSLDFTASKNEALSFISVNRFYNGGVLNVYVSADYDGTVPGIATATWEELNPILPTSSDQNDDKVSSGAMDISSYNSDNVRIAFKYKGSKATNPTTTFQLDKILIFENN